jgi:hypothetical protein
MGQDAPKQSWFRRNWKWVLATLLALGLLGAVIAVVTFNNSDATKLALATATSNSALIERLAARV